MRLIRTNPSAVAPTGLQPGGFCGSVFAVEVTEDLLDRRWIFDSGDDPQRPSAGRTGRDVDTEDPFQALRLGHLGATFGWCRLADVGKNVLQPGKPR